MLIHLHVKNLALIEEAEVDFGEGLNILTGETGAGKSILIGSVNLALGQKLSRDMIREGESSALAELVFQVNKSTEEKLKELDVYPEDGQVIITRKISENRSICKVNGETCTAAAIRRIAELLLDIHGQHEHQSLLYPDRQMEILDKFGSSEIEPVKEETANLYRSYRQVKKELEAYEIDEEQRKREISFLEYEIQEIQEAQLRKGEDEELEKTYKKLANGRKITEALARTKALSGYEEEGGAALIGRALQAISALASLDEELENLCSSLSDIDSLLNDFNRELAEYGKTCEFSEEELYETENRLNEINHLKTKYGNEIESILEYCKKQEERIALLEDYDQYVEDLSLRCRKAEEELKKASLKLSKIRKKQAGLLETEIEEGLKELNFEKVSFVIHFEETADYTAEGIDEVEFRISMNEGQPLRPLSEVASGGELSRIMLAIKTVMAKKDDIETLIFDEIDVGISGRTAQKVSEKMALIGNVHQVICITHLAQIAAMADHHYRIEKRTENGDTRTAISLLDEKESQEELARILGGAEITDTVKKSAAEMRSLAREKKKSLRGTE